MCFDLNIERLITRFRKGFRMNDKIWESVLGNFQG